MVLPFPLSKQDSEPTLPISNTPSSGTTSTLPSNVAPEKEGNQTEPDPGALKHAKDPEAQAELKSRPENQPCLARLPTWISFWLGYRKVPPPPEKNYTVWLWSFIGAFSCIAVIQALFGNVPYFVEKGVPSIGATVILLYGAIESPLSQPRPVVLGHVVGAVTGVCITKLFALLPTEERYDELSWLAGSLCCALALVFMQMTGTMHPPAGATALLAAISPDIRKIGWLYIPVVLLAASIALVIALITNNMQRRYPTFWWTPPPTVAPSFFPTLDLNRTLTRTLTWTSKSKTLNSVRGRLSFKGGKKRAKKTASTPVVPTADQDWHYALKNHSSIFKTGRAGSIRVNRSGSQSRDTSRAPRDRRSKAAPAHIEVGASRVASPVGSYPASPISITPAGSSPASRVQSMDDLHVEFQVHPMRQQHPHRPGHHQQRHSHIHHPHHNTHTTNYLRYLAMKREGTAPPTATGSGAVTPTESTPISRTASVDGLSAMHTPAGHVAHVDFADPVQQEQHAQQLIEAVASIAKERQEQDKEQEPSSAEQEEEQWEDIEEDSGDGPSYLTFRRGSKTKRGDESV
ncbi:HPP-domain-containing protein [Coprinellus micaceus]|uniref:HPP-domain-containing protein n=1 Tax=Coprinellus micaceus TaxID=71717 RepID=A0A4Y7T2Z5_COPMI|nr:HPP-domain-containing protein [Coprinellus micaceus]